LRPALRQVNKGIHRLKFTLAHFSDPHLGPLPPSAAWQDFKLKRLIGTLSWRIKRQRRYLGFLANQVRDDILLQRPDHIALTGDIVNVAALGEFAPAGEWLRSVGDAKLVTFVPGNHDCYVAVPYALGLSHFEDYMTGDMKLQTDLQPCGGTTAFPFVRLRRNIALIGLSTALPQALHRASGQLGPQQLAALAMLLPALKAKGYCRVVLIHHPPLATQASQRRGLRDAIALEKVLAEHGAELVLHGHNHTRSLVYLASKTGLIPISGAPAASMKPSKHHDAAGWTLFSIDRTKGNWVIEAQDRSWDATEQRIVAKPTYIVSKAEGTG
jgi:3',5'-cyclic AMP phosphodiesterase CpdA